MVNSNRFSKIVNSNMVVGDLTCKCAAILVYLRKVIDEKKLFSSSDSKKFIINVDKSFGFCEFSIVVDKAKRKVMIEASILSFKDTYIDEIVDIVNDANNDLENGFCSVIGNSVIYNLSDSFGSTIDNYDIEEAAYYIFDAFEKDYVTLMQGAFCDMAMVVEKEFLFPIF